MLFKKGDTTGAEKKGKGGERTPLPSLRDFKTAWEKTERTTRIFVIIILALSAISVVETITILKLSMMERSQVILVPPRMTSKITFVSEEPPADYYGMWGRIFIDSLLRIPYSQREYIRRLSDFAPFLADEIRKELKELKMKYDVIVKFIPSGAVLTRDLGRQVEVKQCGAFDVFWTINQARGGGEQENQKGGEEIAISEKEKEILLFTKDNYVRSTFTDCVSLVFLKSKNGLIKVIKAKIPQLIR